MSGFYFIKLKLKILYDSFNDTPSYYTMWSKKRYTKLKNFLYNMSDLTNVLGIT